MKFVQINYSVLTLLAEGSMSSSNWLVISSGVMFVVVIWLELSSMTSFIPGSMEGIAASLFIARTSPFNADGFGLESKYYERWKKIN